MSLNKRLLTGGDFARPPRGHVATQEPSCCVRAALGLRCCASLSPPRQGLSAGAALDPRAAAARGHVGTWARRLPRPRRAGSALTAPGFRGQARQLRHASLAARWDTGSFRNRVPSVSPACQADSSPLSHRERPRRHLKTVTTAGATLTARGQRPERPLNTLQGAEEAPRRKRDPAQCASGA